MKSYEEEKAILEDRINKCIKAYSKVKEVTPEIAAAISFAYSCAWYLAQTDK